MYCIKCGSKIDERMKFCPNCGEAIDSDIYNKERKTSNFEEQESVELENTEANSLNEKEQNQDSVQDSSEDGVNKELQKVRDEVARGAYKYVTAAEMNRLSGNLYLTNYKNLYFVSDGKRETYLLELKIDYIVRDGRKVFVEMKDGEEYIFDIPRDVDAQSLVKKTKWASQDNGVVYDDEEVYEETESEYKERKSKFHTKIAAIFIISVIVGALCFALIPTLFEKKESENENAAVEEKKDLRCDECGRYESELPNGTVKQYIEDGEMSYKAKHIYLCDSCKEELENDGVRFTD